jgi:hypothetical protein
MSGHPAYPVAVAELASHLPASQESHTLRLRRGGTASEGGERREKRGEKVFHGRRRLPITAGGSRRSRTEAARSRSRRRWW